jgi:hypothetical protein
MQWLSRQPLGLAGIGIDSNDMRAVLIDGTAVSKRSTIMV